MSGKKRDGTLLSFLVRDSKKAKPGYDDNVVPGAHPYVDEVEKVVADLAASTSASTGTSLDQGKGQEAQSEQVSTQKRKL